VRFHGWDRLQHVPGEFTLVECVSCGFLYLSPRPNADELQQYYPADYLPFRPPLTEERSSIRRFDRLIGLRRRCNVIAKQKPSGSLLDIGCGTGDFLAVMDSYRGWNVRGLEPHEAAATRAREKYELEIDQCRFDEAFYPRESFDVVTLWDVLEHVANPRIALNRIHEILRPDGLVVIGVPNRESFDARLFGPAWAGLDVPRHFSVFSFAHLSGSLREAGFTQVTMSNLNGGYYSFALSVRFWLDRQTSPAWPQALVLGMVNSFLFRLASLPYFSLVKWLRRGSTMIVTAQKQANGI
jgi:SAM-dependent methyltransferase